MVDAGHVRAVGLGQLDRDGAHPAGSSVDQHPVAGRHSVLGKVEERDQPGGGHRGSFLEADPGWLERDAFLGRGGVLGERAAVVPLDAADRLGEDFVPRSEPGHRGPDGLHHPGDVGAGHADLGAPDPGAHQAEHRRPAGHDVPYVGVHRRRPHPNQHLVLGRFRAGDLSQAQLVDTAIAVLDDRPHTSDGTGTSHGPTAQDQRFGLATSPKAETSRVTRESGRPPRCPGRRWRGSARARRCR